MSVWDLSFGLVAPIVEPGPGNFEAPLSARLEQVSSVALGTSHSHQLASASRFVLSNLCNLRVSCTNWFILVI